jgi:hypothetical protein
MCEISDISDTLSRRVQVRLWELGEYLGPETGVPRLIDPAWIKGQLALTTVFIGQEKAKVWATVDLAKVCHPDTIRVIHIS